MYRSYKRKQLYKDWLLEAEWRAAHNLKCIHLWLALLHTITGTVQLVVLLSMYNVNIPLHYSYTMLYNYTYNRPTYFDILSYSSVSWIPGLFLLLAAGDHIYSACTVRQVLYTGSNPARWAEYACSCSLMQVLIAIQSGICSISLLICIATLTASCMYCGYLAEQEEWIGKNLNFWVGCIPFTVVWCLILTSFTVVSQHTEQHVPAWVVAIIVSMIILQSLFAVVMYCSKTYKWTVYKQELAYSFLSLVAKQLLAWLFLGGVISLVQKT